MLVAVIPGMTVGVAVGVLGAVGVALGVALAGGKAVAVAVAVAAAPVMVTAPLIVLPGTGNVVLASLKLTLPLKTTGVITPVQAVLAVTWSVSSGLTVAGSVIGVGERAKTNTSSVSINVSPSRSTALANDALWLAGAESVWLL